MRIALQGTGDAGGTPRYGCECAACRNIRRGPTHATVQTDGMQILLDAGSAFPLEPPQAVLLTHFHIDHVQGLFPLRWGMGDPVHVFAPDDPERMKVLFGTPGLLEFHHPLEPFDLGSLTVTPIPLQHSVPTLGWLLEDNEGCLAYLVDTKGLPDASRDLLRATPIDLLVLDATSPPGVESPNHNDLDEAFEIVRDLQPHRTLLVHVSHDLDTWKLGRSIDMPDGVEFVSDGHALAVVQGK